MLGEIRREVGRTNMKNPVEKRPEQRLGLMLEGSRVRWGEGRVKFIIQNKERVIYGWRT